MSVHVSIKGAVGSGFCTLHVKGSLTSLPEYAIFMPSGRGENYGSRFVPPLKSPGNELKTSNVGRVLKFFTSTTSRREIRKYILTL